MPAPCSTRANPRVLGDFRDATFVKDGITTTFSRRDGKFFIATEGPDGKPGDFEVTFTFGLAPLQQYLVDMPDGRLQAFGIAWDSRPEAAGGQRWFDLYPGQKLSPGDPLHWTGIQQTANFMCVDCHVTNFRKGFDATSPLYEFDLDASSVWAAKSCHGPAGDHVAWAAPAHPADVHAVASPRAPPTARPLPGAPIRRHGRRRAGRPPGKSPKSRPVARCHARRSQFTDAIHAGQPLADAFRLTCSSVASIARTARCRTKCSITALSCKAACSPRA